MLANLSPLVLVKRNLVLISGTMRISKPLDGARLCRLGLGLWRLAEFNNH